MFKTIEGDVKMTPAEKSPNSKRLDKALQEVIKACEGYCLGGGYRYKGKYICFKITKVKDGN